MPVTPHAWPIDMKTLRRSWKWLLLLALATSLIARARLVRVPALAHIVVRGPITEEVMGTGTLEARVKTTLSPRIQERLAEVLVDYTLTLDKLHDIAMLKLIGARNGVIVGLILQQALLMGALGYDLAWWLGQYAFPRFPRLVIIEDQDLLMLGGMVLAVSALASLLGIAKAMRVEPNKTLAG